MHASFFSLFIMIFELCTSERAYYVFIFLIEVKFCFFRIYNFFWLTGWLADSSVGARTRATRQCAGERKHEKEEEREKKRIREKRTPNEWEREKEQSSYKKKPINNNDDGNSNNKCSINSMCRI